LTRRKVGNEYNFLVKKLIYRNKIEI